MKFSGLDAHWWLVIVAPVIVVLLINFLLRVAPRFGAPNGGDGFEASKAITPAIYGLVVFLVFLLMTLVTVGLPGNSRSLLAAMVIVVAVGIAADTTRIDFNYRLFAQLVAVLVIVSGTTVHVTGFGDLFGAGNIVLGKWSILATLLSAIGLINAIRLTDTLDGLPGALSMVALMIFVGVAVSVNDFRLGFEIALLCGAIAGVFLFNFSPQGKIYSRRLGGAACLVIGLFLYWYAAQLAGTPKFLVNPITLVWILALPLLDLASQMFVRVLQRKSPLYADRQHWYLFLTDAGYSGSQVVAVTSFASLMLGLIGWQAARIGVPESIMFFLFLCLFGANLFAVLYPQNFIRLAVRIWPPKTGGDGANGV